MQSTTLQTAAYIFAGLAGITTGSDAGLRIWLASQAAPTPPSSERQRRQLKRCFIFVVVLAVVLIFACYFGLGYWVSEGGDPFSLSKYWILLAVPVLANSLFTMIHPVPLTVRRNIFGTIQVRVSKGRVGLKLFIYMITILLSAGALLYPSSSCKPIAFAALVHSLSRAVTGSSMAISRLLIGTTVYALFVLGMTSAGMVSEIDFASTGLPALWVDMYFGFIAAAAFVGNSGSIAAILLRFDHCQALENDPSLAEELEFKVIPASSCGRRAGFAGDSVEVPPPGVASFQKPYFIGAIVAWTVSQVILMVGISKYPCLAITGNNAGFQYVFLFAPVGTLAMVMAAVFSAAIRGNLIKLWKYKEEWKTKPVDIAETPITRPGLLEDLVLKANEEEDNEKASLLA